MSGFRYRPANSKASLSPEARKIGRESMKEFLLSPQLQEPVSKATEDIADAAKALAVADGLVDSGEYSEGFEGQVGAPIVIAGNRRVAGRVVNDAAHSAALEWGNSRATGHHVLGRAGQPFHSEKRPM